MEIIDYLLARKKAGGGSDVTIEQLSVTENGTYSEQGIAYSPVVVNVPTPANSYQLKDVPSGTVSTIDDGTALPMPSLKVGIEPVQEGSGDPSPENIRPISGWDECNVSDVGANVWDEEWEVGSYSIDTGKKNDAGYCRCKNFIPVKPLQTYYFLTSGDSLWRFMYDKDKRYIGYLTGIINNPWEIPNNVYYINIVDVSRNAYDPSVTPISINYPSTDTEYHAYNGQTYTIQFKDGDNPLTIYGGTLDVTTGELVVDRVNIDMGNLNYAYDTPYNRFVSGDIPNTEAPSGARITSFISSIYEVVDDSRPISQVTSGQMYSSFNSAQTKAIVMVHDNRFTDAALFRNAVSGQTFTYELAEPITYQLTPTQVRTLVGTNNIWADTGNIIEGKYFKSLS